MQEYIIVFNNFINGGCENLFISIARKCKDVNFKLIILRKNIDTLQLSKLPTNVEIINCKYQHILIRFIFYKKYIKRYFANVISIIDFHEVLLCELFLYINRKKFHCWHWFNCNPLMKLKKKTSYLYYKLFSFYEKVIFICDTQKKLLQQIVKSYPDDKCYISYNFVDKEKIISLSEEYNIQIYEKYIISIARIDYEAKDFETLLKAYELLSNDIKRDYKLVIVGDGKDMDRLKSRVVESNDKNNILLLGNLTNPYPWLKNASLFILSSYTEGFPITILEAFVLGIPVISSNCLCGPKEILNTNEYGDLFEIGDYETLCTKIRNCLNNKLIHNQFSNKGKARGDYYLKSADKSVKELLCL